MTETATGKIQETQVHRYSSTKGINHSSVPWRLWERSKELFWNPADLDFSKDRQDWQEMSQEQQVMIAASARGFMVGEEAVTLDILPLLRVMSDEGRLEDTMYLSMFAMEEAKHVDFFRRWFDAVEFDPTTLNAFVRRQNRGDGNGDGYGDSGSGNGEQPRRRTGLFDGELTRVMRRLDTDRSPEAVLDASLVYNHLVEGIAAIAGYQRWNAMFASLGGDKLPAMQEGLRLVQRDERRHIAYGTYLCRRIIAEHPETWEFVERRWNELTGGILQEGGQEQATQDEGGYGGAAATGLRRTLAQRRLDVLAVARKQALSDVEGSQIEELEPADL